LRKRGRLREYKRSDSRIPGKIEYGSETIRKVEYNRGKRL